MACQLRLVLASRDANPRGVSGRARAPSILEWVDDQ